MKAQSIATTAAGLMALAASTAAALMIWVVSTEPSMIVTSISGSDAKAVVLVVIDVLYRALSTFIQYL